MGLAQGIVIVNEYTINKGGKGSRGSTPGDYVTNYMSRGTATETLTPVKLTEQEDYITRYMTRKDAVELIDDTTVHNRSALLCIRTASYSCQNTF